MTNFTPWNSQSLEDYTSRFAEGEIIDLAGRRTHFVERGEGSPVILIHGFNLDWHTWSANLDALASHFKVYALDLWGQGLSTREPLDYGFPLFAEQLRLFMDALAIERASLVGHSMGGGTSIVFSLHHRPRVEKLVLLDSSGIPTELPFRAKIFRLPGVAELLMSLPTDRIRRMNLTDIWIHQSDRLTDERYAEFTRYQKIRGTTEALLSILRRDFFNTLRDEIRALGQMDVPTLIIWGREDRSLPLRCGEEMHRLMPASRLEIIDDAGHLANFDRPSIFDRLVIDFLREPA
jgi:pimeloyl-ACP methyl ester carboxylesterase